MSSRYPPARDRSPPRQQLDRRPSATYTPTSSNTYRPPNDSAPNSSDRAPPRGPRADSFRGGAFTFGPSARGRGGFSRSDIWDRDRDRDRDARPAASTFRRDDERQEWRGRDREFGVSDRGSGFNRERSYVGRERSASPTRPRRDSKENIPSAASRTSDSTPSYFASGSRGVSTRGRGRGDWDRSRGRSSFVGERERDLFAPRSRSREGWRERDYDRGRAFGTDAERSDRFDRREYDRAGDRDARPREHDVWQREQSPARSSAGNRAVSPSGMSTMSQDRPYKPDYDGVRKSQPLQTPMSARDTRRDTEADYFSSRIDSGRKEATSSQPFTTATVPQSASLGLDYGSPPSAPATTPSTLEKLSKPTQQQPVKTDPPATPAAFQPPSGPKAERGPPTPNAVQTFDQRQKSEGLARLTREQPPKSSDVPFEPKPTPVSGHADRPLPPNIPSGPRAGTIPPFKARISPIEQSLQNAPYVTPTPAKTGALDNRGPPTAVPTGPRANAFGPPSGPRGGPPSGPAGSPPLPGSASWRRVQPDFRPQKPSIMNQLNKPYQTDRMSHMNAGHATNPQNQFVRANIGRPGVDSGLDPDKKRFSPTMNKVSMLGRSPGEDPTSLVDIEMSMQASEEEDDVEDDDGLDEDYYAMSEESHAREMDLLRSKKPLPVLQDPIIINLLIRVQMLGMIMEGIIPDGIEKSQGPTRLALDTDPMPSLGTLSPEKTPEGRSSIELEHPQPRGRPLKEPPINPIPTPPIEDLPYLNKSGPSLTVFDDAEDGDVESEAITMLLRQQFEHDAWDQRGDLEDLQNFYRRKYPEWRYDIERLERIRRETHEPTPDPGSPGAQSVTSLPLPVERLTGRAARNATEFDIEKAILMSQQSAKEEEERREREAASNATPNYDTEAHVPFMLEPTQREPIWKFEDCNRFVPTDLVVELMRYVPPEDDFTDEEQTAFITAFCQTPKKWGTIADAIPGKRTYQECIAHYYLTKNDAHYKEIWRRSQPKRKRGRAATKPRSTALISDMALNEDNESTPVPMTDSGRPRRAAAPTFGDVALEGEAASALPASKRLAAGPRDGSETGVGRGGKGRKPGAGTKPRRTKAQMLADAQAMGIATNGDSSPHKVLSGRSRTLLRADNVGVKPDVLGTPSMIVEGSMVPLPQSALSTQSGTVSAPVVTSYWSVPEQQKFRQLIAYYGRDYARIAEFMKTKSQAMIKNHFTREIGKGDQDLEKIALLAEDKRDRGEPMGPPPSPIAPPKRKYEATTSVAGTSRALAVAPDTLMPESDRQGLSSKVNQVEDFPANTIHRDANGGLVAKPQARDIMQHSPVNLPVHPKMEEIGRERAAMQQKSMQGPPRGHFAEDPGAYQTNHPRPQILSAEHVLHHHPPQLVDLRVGDGHAPTSGSMGRTPHGQLRDQVHPSQIPTSHHGYQPGIVDRPASSSRHGHGRNGSLSVNSQSALDQAADLASLRNAESSRRPQFGMQPGHSPGLVPIQSSLPPRADPSSAASSIPKPEPPKPAPAKRSNVFSILNDEPEPPVKRTSTDSMQRAMINTPPPSILQQSQQRAQEDIFHRQPQTTYGHLSQSSQGHSVDYRAGYSSSPAPGHRDNPWLDKFDPRPQGPSERAGHSSPALSAYSLIPPSSQQSSLPGMQSRLDGSRGLDSTSHRRSLLGMSHASSPPPQHANPPYRSTSASSHHGRMSSIGYQSNQQTSQDHKPLQQQQTSGPQISQPQSTNSTPVSALHQRGPSLGLEPRLTIQQHMAQQRELDMISHQRDPHGRQIALPTHEQYRQEPSHHAAPTVPPPPSQTSQPSHTGIGYASQPPRTYTPPAYNSDPRAHGHQHHHSMSQHQSQGPPPSGSQQHQIAPPPPSHQGMGHAHQQSHQAQHQQGAGHGHQQQQQHQHQQHQQRPPPPPLGLGQNFGPPQGHYRGYSQGGEERR